MLGVYAVLDAVDDAYPGLLDYYATIRSEGVPGDRSSTLASRSVVWTR
ncbi:putative protein OS=Tsukamurella paurometabola (strain ATCC 8368 / DSM / CCUG 35730 /CIP 100753 / JCM 10117 / KCTC 9821 / NBRC 16120 / NCIMB 702349/ NCTC 13040) OX=521096 GN=Tpau_4332 PE=4 SV=1 [Tsukamurella paurometabola]|uniref:Uncharacterized protein n=1 Tax=Tsukamurella paurometabola (strain ATCC 8368 / DSM 20162 / CCUG 35730 / CIP 100753 / JCM 10117 / KCTC 9821 / NBRC 16120 / NCIMB 702349 / NCTC 13040) TaxID=521096 RepID=D5UZ46_TSUPD|nr:hypothetical protein [Tsukamurella paurometabola]ADG80893.1 hypothetical protein Tpau_4332 [Tsukamurella paurometabola DSM 20162]SUQ39259.1 Uncharacterised protein [Tsukamurella paurometabola]